MEIYRVIAAVIYLCSIAICAVDSRSVYGNHSISSKIHRGKSAKKGQYAYTVWIQTGKRKYHCGASLVDEEWVLTAASCVPDSDLEAYTFVIGDYKFRRIGDGEIRAAADRIILHPFYATGMAGNDLALVHLTEKISDKGRMVDFVPQMYGDDIADIIANQGRCMMTGWGPKRNGKMNPKMQFMPITMVDDAECSNIAVFEANSSLCFTGDPGAPCGGDMGSPIVCEVDDQWVQVAIQTYGTCKDGFHVGSKVAPFTNWMTKIQLNNFCGNTPFVANGRYVTTGGNVAGDQAILYCDGGFRRTVVSDFEATIRCQQNGQWSQTNALCVRDCTNPPFVANGRFVLAQGTSVAILECNVGFRPSSETGRTIVCQENGQWSSTGVTCIGDSSQGCANPPFVANGQFVLIGGAGFDSQAILVCNAGFQPSSEQGRTITCSQGGQWSSSFVTCIRETQVCGFPPFVSNGEFVVTGGQTGINAQAILVCNAGFRPSSEQGRTIQCQQNGQWSQTGVQCIRDSQGCGQTPFVSNGRFVLQGGTSVAILECDFGFLPTSEAGRTIYCQNGIWSQTNVQCRRDTGNQGCGNPPFVANGQFTRTSDPNVAILQCDPNFRPSSEIGRTITCTNNNQWSTTNVVCISNIQGCGNPPFVSNGQFVTQGTGNVNDVAVLTCYSGYQPSQEQGRTIFCGQNGQWTQSNTICIRGGTQGCNNPPFVNNGYFVLIGTNTAVLECNPGYQASSEQGRYITCQSNGQWQQTGVQCISGGQGQCGNPPFVSNGRFTQITGSSVAILECNVGYRPSSEFGHTIVCQNTGQWSQTSTTCIGGNPGYGCGNLPFVANGQYVIVDGARDTAILSCNSGYRPSSEFDRNIYCQQNGQWSQSTTQCIGQQQGCGSTPFINNGRFIVLINNPSTAILECNAGYQPSSESGRTIVCQNNGRWSQTNVQCIRSNQQGCGNPPYIANGQFVLTGSSNQFNAQAILVCNQGYRPSSEIGRTINCQQNGIWAQTNVQCIRDNFGCGALPYVANGQFVPTGITNDQAVLVCNAGYQPSSEAGRTIFCTQNGQWSQTNVQCIRFGQGCASKGTSFMIGFPKGTNGKGKPYLFTLTTTPTTLVVSVPFYNQNINYNLVSGAVWFFDPNLQGSSPEEINRKGVHIQANSPITVIAHNYEPGNGPSAEGTLIHPERCLSTEYIVITHDKAASNQFRQNVMITATTGNTFVTLELSNGQQRSVTLGRFGTYHYSGYHLIGARVRATHPVIVLAGHECGNVPSANVGRCDHLLEQMPPTSSLQRSYILTYMRPRPYYSVRIIALRSNTVVTIRDVVGTVQRTFQLNRYSTVFVNVINSFTISIVSNYEILVAQFGQGTDADRLNIGDPSMVVHPGLNQFESFYQMYLPSDFYNQHWVAITIREQDNYRRLRLNNQQIAQVNPIRVFVPGEGTYYVIHVQLFNPINTLSHTSFVTFGAMQYGFHNKVEYAWNAGRLM